MSQGQVVRVVPMRVRNGCIALLMLVCATAESQVNSWNSLTSGNWEDLSWSLGGRPALSQSIMITNTGSKAVGISTITTSSYPATQTITNLTVSAPAGFNNTLLLNYSGTGIPLHVLNTCTIGANGALANMHGGLNLELSAPFATSCSIIGTVSQQGGAWNALSSIVALAGGSVDMQGDCTFRQFELQTGTFNQGSGTTIMTNLNIATGTYNLSNGFFRGTISISPSSSGGQFNQYGGTNYGPSLSIMNGTCRFYGGSLAGVIAVGQAAGSFAHFQQTSGLLNATYMNVGGFTSARGDYAFTNGTISSGYLEINSGNFTQAGGVHAITNQIHLNGFLDTYDGSQNRFCNYTLLGGLVSCADISMGDLSHFSQSGGTNNVSDQLSVYHSTFTLTGGTLNTTNTALGPLTHLGDGTPFNAFFVQSGGVHHVSNLLSNRGDYTISGGTLIAKDIVQQLTMTISNGPVAPFISNPGLFSSFGMLTLKNTSQQLGTLVLAGDSTFDFASGASVLKFLDSGSAAWSGSSILTITNWSGLPGGGGTDQLKFGNSASGLSSAQLAQIRFINPAGFAAGTYFAKILSTGEVVPSVNPILVWHLTQQVYVLTWPPSYFLQTATSVQGPYLDVLNATSPYTNNTPKDPRRFWRLRR
jgi:hypothetical protein